MKFDELKVSRNSAELRTQKADERQSVDLRIPAYEITSNSLIDHPSAAIFARSNFVNTSMLLLGF